MPRSFTPISADLLRIALVSDWFAPRLGGVELHVADLARALAERGNQVAVLTTTPGTVGCEGVELERLPLALAPFFGFSISPYTAAVLRDRLAGRFDVVHAHVSIVSPLGFAALALARRERIPAVATFHSALHRSVQVLKWSDRAFGWSTWPMIVSGVSRTVADQLQQAAPNMRAAVLENGVDAHFWRNGRKDGSGPDGAIRIASAMRLARKKRPLALLESFRRARDALATENIGLRLTIAGEGPERPKLESFLARWGLAEEVALPGALDRRELRRLYAESDLFALASVAESFGLALLEARLAGLPVAAMALSGARDFLFHDDNALLAPDDSQMTANLVRLARDRELRERLSRPDPRLERYAWPSVVDRHLAHYAQARRLTSARV